MEDTKILIEPPDEEVLDEGDCYTVLQELEAVAYRWYEIGLALGLLPSTLERIKSSTSGESGFDKMLTSVIVEWLKMNYNTARHGKPTWTRIVEAVRASAGGSNPAHADLLERKHCAVSPQYSQPIAICTPPSSRIIQASPEMQASVWCCLGCKSSQTRGRTLAVNERTALCVSSDTRENTNPHKDIQIPRKSSKKKTLTKSEDSADSGISTGISKSLQSSASIILAHPTWEIEEITQQDGYCGAMTGKEAEQNLRSCGGNCYLIRYSQKKDKYVISVIRRESRQAITHYQVSIRKIDGRCEYEIEGTRRKFPSIATLLEFYQKTPLTRSNRTIGRAYTQPSNYNTLS